VGYFKAMSQHLTVTTESSETIADLRTETQINDLHAKRMRLYVNEMEMSG
jgi:hypothetical protein